MLAQIQFHRARKIHQHLHYAVKAMNLGVDDFKMTDSGTAGLAQLGLEQLKMHHDGVDGILDLVAHAGGEPADRRHAP